MMEQAKRVEGNCTHKRVQLWSTGKTVTRIMQTQADHKRLKMSPNIHLEVGDNGK